MIAYFVYLTLRGFSFFINLLPEPICLWIGRQMGRLIYYLDGRHRKVAIQNLHQAFGQEKSGKELRAIAETTFRNLGMMAMEFFRIPKMKTEAYKRKVSVEGLDEAEDPESEKRGTDACWPFRKLGTDGIHVEGDRTSGSGHCQTGQAEPVGRSVDH
jgi:lauroyl/myristoyl acyltransferase